MALIPFQKIFARITAIINFVAMVNFIKTMCYDIFEYLFIAYFKYWELFDFVSTYFGTIKVNGRGILHLHCLVWLCTIFHRTQLRKQLEADFEYFVCIVKFINCIIKYSIISEDEIYTSQSNTSSAFVKWVGFEFYTKTKHQFKCNNKKLLNVFVN